ncbi:MAG: M24 family metallopeptidase [Candidatus Aminicenantia bacterium]
MDRLLNEKLEQVINILKEKWVDLWLTFVRETELTIDPILPYIVGVGCTWQSAFIITSKSRRVAIVGSLDKEKISRTGLYSEIIPYIGSIKESLLKILEEEKPSKIALNFSKDSPSSDGLTHGMFLKLMEYFEGTEWKNKIVSSEEIISAMRGRKTPEEIKRIENAIKITEKIFEKVTGFSKPGMTEIEIAKFIKEEVKKEGVELAWEEETDPAVFAGPQGVGAHSGPTEKKLKKGEVLNIDFGVKFKGYVSDLQRVWYVPESGNEIPEKVKLAFETIKKAIRIAKDFLKQGVKGWEVDEVAREYIKLNGFDEYPHALGHPIGRSVHDGGVLLAPRWERYGSIPYMQVEEGNVFTLEPRINLPEFGVVSIEEIVVVEKTGSRFLSTPQEEIFMIK